MKYSDQLAGWLARLGYTHCFFVAGGNIMHLLESCRHHFSCIPVVHEVAAGIATEYFNESQDTAKAFALVTAGPGLTNIVTAMAGAFLESRELLVIGGQAKTADLSRGQVRQRGIQEIDGVAIVESVTVRSARLDQPVNGEQFAELVGAGCQGRKGPVFIEIPLDVQASSQELTGLPASAASYQVPPPTPQQLTKLGRLLESARRPAILIGAGVSRTAARALSSKLGAMGIPLLTTWNGADRVPATVSTYFGRPNTWGQRYSNLLMQQADVLVALGSRLGLQQTGFNWQTFVPHGKVVQVDCDQAELDKGHPRVDLPIYGDADAALAYLVSRSWPDWSEWRAFCRHVQASLPLAEACNQTRSGFISPYDFALLLSELSALSDIIVPCSSGGAFTTMMQAFNLKDGQVMITNKGLAAMGYGLSGAIGAALANPARKVLLVEGDGGFSQNLQELGTVAANQLDIKIFIYDDNGYASIRMTQRNYFNGAYVGCDLATGLGLPDWDKLFEVYGIPAMRLAPGFSESEAFLTAFNGKGPAAFIVPIDPEQTYFPKITSQIAPDGGMISNPLHRMSPFLDDALMADLGRYLG